MGGGPPKVAIASEARTPFLGDGGTMVSSQEILVAWSQMRSISGIVKKYGCSFSRVRKVLATNNIIVNESHEKVLQLHASGISVENIAEQVHLSVAVVRSYLPAVRPVYGDTLSGTTAWRRKQNTGNCPENRRNQDKSL